MLWRHRVMQPTRGRGKHVHGHRLVENSTEGVAQFDEQGRMVYCNRASEMILGCKLEDLVGRAIVDFVHADDRRIIKSVLQQCMEKPGEPVATRVRMFYGDGSYRLIDGVFNNLLNDPDIEAIVCNYRDVTRIVAAESGWRESEERFAKAFRTCPVAFTMATQAEARYLDVNDAFLEMLDYERDEVIGRTSIDLNLWVEPQDRTRMLQLLAESRIARGLRTKLRTARGEIRDVKVSAELVEVEGAPCVLAIIQDLTEVMQLEDRFRQAQKIEAVGRLASGVAHDFNNLLGVIMGYSELSLQHLGPDSAVSRNLIRIKMAADRAAGLTRQLLTFSRKQVLYPRILDLNKLVTNLSEMVLRMIREDVSLSFSPASQPPRVKADPGQIDQILMNLIVNAQDAMPNG